MIIRTDPIADFLTRIRNAQRARHVSVSVPMSKLKWTLAKLLEAEGYIASVAISEENARSIVMTLKYSDHDRRQPIIRGLKRRSKPGQRIYATREQLPRVLNGLGISVVSTSKGLMTDSSARKQKLGGEILCEVW